MATSHNAQDVQENIRMCQKFLSTLIKLASNQSEKTVSNVKTLIQSLIDGNVEPKDFTDQLEKELKSAPQPYLVPFLRKFLPFLRRLLYDNKMTIDGIRAPPVSVVNLEMAMPPVDVEHLSFKIPTKMRASSTRDSGNGHPKKRKFSHDNASNYEPAANTVVNDPHSDDSDAMDELVQNKYSQCLSFDDLPEKYKLEPRLVHTLTRIKTARENHKSINGLTILDNELFVVSARSSEVDVYDSMQLSLDCQSWDLYELVNPFDIASCSRNKCLYISNYKSRFGRRNEILRVDPNGELIKKWSTGNDFGRLSVTDKSNVILTVYGRGNKLKEYSPDGQLIRSINLRSHADIRHPFHAVKLASGNFLVCYGGTQGRRKGVCEVFADGMFWKSFGGDFGSDVGQLNDPVYLAVDGNGFVIVADRFYSRVLLLNSDLQFKKEILNEKHGLRQPCRIFLDELNGRLFVADNVWKDEARILIYEFIAS